MILWKGVCWWGMRKKYGHLVWGPRPVAWVCEFDNSECKKVKGVQKGCLTHKIAMTLNFLSVHVPIAHDT